MRQHPVSVLTKLQHHVDNRHRIVISAITYAELRFGTIGKNASPKHNGIVDEFIARIDSIEPWDQSAVEAAATIKKHLNDKGAPIGMNNTMIAGHAVAHDCILITHNTKEFNRVQNLVIEDWA